ncbi:MAG: UvrD-helicase domain-containing protein [Polyangiaceae bacterium]|nr:UvrD-helicase domain-containing protein [Polyangiaceae bacterium]
MPELNAPQAEAAAHTDGPLLVFAGAGSGKTRVITFRIANLLSQHRVPPYRILAVTFTNKAAGELKARLEHLAGADVTRDLWAGTFHSVCARLLRRYHEEAGLGPRFVIYDESDQKAVISRLLKERGLDDRRMPPRWVLSKIHAQKREGHGPDDLDAQTGFDAEWLDLFKGYQKALRCSNAVDFEDLIVLAMRVAEDPSSAAGRDLRERFRYVLVDEFQDTNITQYRLVRALSASSRNLCVVGDDDQSIYRWRGADVRIIRGFRRDFPDAQVVKLEQNYRSSANIVKAALGVIAPALEREPKQLWTDAALGEPVRIRTVPTERDEAAFIVRTVRAELLRGVDPKGIAVFYRVHAQSRVIEEALRAENVPYQIIGGMRFFERAEVKDLVAYLRLIDNPKSDADLLRVINVPARGIGDKTVDLVLGAAAERSLSAFEALSALVREGALTGAAKTKLRGFVELMAGLAGAAPGLLPSELAGHVLEATGYRSRLREEDSAESDARLENLQELIGSIREYEEGAAARSEPATLSGWLERVTLASAVDAAKDVPSISLMTVHAAKGLEFTTVILTGLEEETFPYRGMDSDGIDDLEEERRLAYVAVTRARERLFITHAEARTLFGRTSYKLASRFLRDLPDEAVVREGVQRTPYLSSSPRDLDDEYSPPPRPRAPAWQAAVDQARARMGTAQPGERVIDREAFDDLGDADAVAIRPGDRVRHKQFGRGVVERVEHDGSVTVVARFPGHGSKRLRAEYLEPA